MLPEPRLVSSLKQIPDSRLTRVEEYFQARNLAANTVRAYRRALKRFLAWTDCSWQEFKQQDLDRYKDHLLQLALAPATVCQELSALKNFFTWLGTRRYIDINPAAFVELPKIPPKLEPVIIALDIELDFEYLVRDSLRDTALLKVLFYGLRRSEISKLKLGDYKDGLLYIRDAKCDSDRIVPLLEDAILALDQYLEERLAIDTETDALFLSQGRNSMHQPLKPSGIYYFCKTWLQINPHACRHTFCDRLIRSGMEPSLAMQLTGHKNTSSLEVYGKQALQDMARRRFLEINSTFK